jgi:hypothetical protein
MASGLCAYHLVINNIYAAYYLIFSELHLYDSELIFSEHMDGSSFHYKASWIAQLYDSELIFSELHLCFRT